MDDNHRQAPWRRVAALGLSLLLVPVGCGGGGSTGDEARPTEDSRQRMPAKGGELVFGVEANPMSLAPGVASHPSEVLIALGIYDPLATYINGRVAPFLAASMESNDELTKYTITLRDGVTFHDGTPLNADAVVRHFDRLKDPATACPCAAALGLLASMETPDGPDGLTVVFNLGAPSVAFPDLLAGSSGYIESPTAVATGLDLTTGGVGTGPFTLAQFVPGERVVLEANARYWGTDEAGTRLPYLDRLTVVPISGSDAGLTLLATGEIDILQTEDWRTVRQAEEAGYAAQKITGSGSVLVLFNNAKPPFDDIRARQAVAYAIDRDLINERIYDGVRLPSYSQFDVRSAYYNADAGSPEHDRERAADLVDELGGLEFTIICPSMPEIDPVLQIIKQMGEAAGMEITLETQEQGAFLTRMFGKGGDYEAACFRSSHFVEPDAVRPGLTTDDGANLVLYSNSEVDRLLDEARRTAEFKERKDRYFRVQEITAEEVPLVPTLYGLTANIYADGRVGPPPDGELNSLGAIKPARLYVNRG